MSQANQARREPQVGSAEVVGATPPSQTKQASSSYSRFDIDRILKYAPADLIGRENELAMLDDTWEKVVRDEELRPHILTFVALGGEGKTSLMAKWTAELAHHDWRGCEAAFAWSFYSQGTSQATALQNTPPLTIS